MQMGSGVVGRQASIAEVQASDRVRKRTAQKGNSVELPLL